MDEAQCTDDERKPAAKFAKDDGNVSSASSSSNHKQHKSSHSHAGPNKKVKPALKKDAKAAAKKKEKQLKWDEVAIEEHDALRGTRMKIDEPNTPYTQYDSGAESDDSRRPKSPANQKNTLSWDVLQTRLDSVAAVREAYPSSPSAADTDQDQDQSDVDVEEDTKKEMRRLEFKEHRKRHYNEMEALRKFRAEHPDGILPSEAEQPPVDAQDDDDDDDDDADDEAED